MRFRSTPERFRRGPRDGARKSRTVAYLLQPRLVVLSYPAVIQWRGANVVRLRTAILSNAALLLSTQISLGQSFNQAIIFGDSTVDSGFYKTLPNPGGGATYNSLWAQAVAAGAGAPTTNPGPMNSQSLSGHFMPGCRAF